MGDWGYDDMPPPQSAIPPMMPSQPSQAIAPQGAAMPTSIQQLPQSAPLQADVGVPQMDPLAYYADAQRANSGIAQSAQATELQNALTKKQMKLYKTADEVGQRLSGTHPDQMPEGDAITQQLMGTLDTLNSIRPGGGFSFMPGGNARNRERDRTYATAQTEKVNILKALAEHADKGDSTTLNLLGELHKSVGEVHNTQAEMDKGDAREERIKMAQEKLKLAQAAEDRHLEDSKSMNKLRAAHLEAYNMLTPVQKQQYEAKIQQLGIQNDILGQTGLPTANAKLSILKAAPGQKNYNAATQRMMATGQELPGADQLPPGMVPPPPPEQSLVPPPVATTPKLTAKGLQTQANTELAGQRTQHEANVNEAESMKLQRRADTSVRAMVSASPERGKADYWKAHPDEWKRIVEKTPHIAERIKQYVREGK